MSKLSYVHFPIHKTTSWEPRDKNSSSFATFLSPFCVFIFQQREREREMEKMVALRSLCRSVWSRSYRMGAMTQQLHRHYYAGRSLFNFSSPPTSMTSSNALASSGNFFLLFWLSSKFLLYFSIQINFIHKVLDFVDRIILVFVFTFFWNRILKFACAFENLPFLSWVSIGWSF